MSVGNNLNEMENVVTKGAKAGEKMSSVKNVTPGQTGSWEDLGGPTPQNYKSTDDSSKLKEPSVKTVSDVVTSKAKDGDRSKTNKVTLVPEEVEDEEDLVIDEDDLDEFDVEEDDEETTTIDAQTAIDDDLEDEVTVEYDIEEDVNALLSGEDLSEEFQEKARVIFEAAINSKVAEIKTELKEYYENALVEEIAAIQENLTERMDAYLEYVAEEWITENQLAIERGIKGEITESFLSGIKSLFEEHYVEIPEDKYDVLESMVDKIDEMEQELNEQINRNIALNQMLTEKRSLVIFDDVTEGLALSQKEKLANLIENVEFDGEESYREKLVALRESYFPQHAPTQESVAESLEESYDITEEVSPETNPRMAMYLKALGNNL